MEDLNIEFLHNLCKVKKHIHDVLYKTVELSEFAIEIIDSKIFQRLRNLKQLGLCFYAYPNATHTRFEHSIGTYHMAKIFTNALDHNSDNKELCSSLETVTELKSYFNKLGKVEFNQYIKELISIASLCHDIGHGPFSHLYDELYLKKHIDSEISHHEVRSQKLFEYIIKKSEKLSKIPDEHIKFVQNLINPRTEHKSFVYQILSSDIDVDKFDYINRDTHSTGINEGFHYSRLVSYAKVIDGNIAFAEQCIDDLKYLLDLRHRLFKRVYLHKKVIMWQYLIVEYLELINMDICELFPTGEEWIEKFIKLDDCYVMKIYEFLRDFRKDIHETEKFKKLEVVVEKITKHKINKLIGCISSRTEQTIDTKEIANHIKIDPELVTITKIIIKPSGKKDDILDMIPLYKTNVTLSKKFMISTIKNHYDCESHSHEYIYYISVKANELEPVPNIDEIYDKMTKYFSQNFKGIIIE